MKFGMGLFLLVASTAIFSPSTVTSAESSAMLLPSVQRYIESRILEFDQIPESRKAALISIADYVSGQIKSGNKAKLTFICTHNSRRSHLSQIWASVAAAHYGVVGVECYSGGTEATAFNPRAADAIRRAGLVIEKGSESSNPRYLVRFQNSGTPLEVFSKVFLDAPNPTADYCAVMTCDQADKQCPIVNGCTLRMPLPYEDPKVADDTAIETAKYDERCQQICREMMFLFSRVTKQL